MGSLFDMRACSSHDCIQDPCNTQLQVSCGLHFLLISWLSTPTWCKYECWSAQLWDFFPFYSIKQLDATGVYKPCTLAAVELQSLHVLLYYIGLLTTCTVWNCDVRWSKVFSECVCVWLVFWASSHADLVGVAAIWQLNDSEIRNLKHLAWRWPGCWVFSLSKQIPSTANADSFYPLSLELNYACC